MVAAVVEDALGNVSLLIGDGVWDGLVDGVFGAVVIGKRGKAVLGWLAWLVLWWGWRWCLVMCRACR